MSASQVFFYDGQIERFLVQFIRMMSGFHVEFGVDDNGNKTLQRVPVFYGDSSRQVAQIIASNSENSTPVVPAMTVYISNLTYDRERVQEPTFVSKMHLRQREFNEGTGEFTEQQGNAITVERLMPVPYMLELKLDIWTSSTRQKLQLVEQIGVLFNPGLEIQSTDNYIDWTSLSIVFLDNQSWSSRSVPVGTDNPIDVNTMVFKLPIWLSPPAKIKQMGVIQKIISNIHESNGDLSGAILNDANLLGQRQYLTPLGYGVMLSGDNLTLLKYEDITDPRDPTVAEQGKIGTKDVWRKLIDVYGTLSSGVSQVRLMSDNQATEIVGTITEHATDDTKMIFSADIDTYPANSLINIDAIIDPTKVPLGDIIAVPAAGTRYILLGAIGDFSTAVGSDAEAWRGTDGSVLVANANDVIEFNGTKWAVSFDSQSASEEEYVTNLNTSVQFKWNRTAWVKSFAGEYRAGEWALVL